MTPWTRHDDDWVFHHPARRPIPPLRVQFPPCLWVRKKSWISAWLWFHREGWWKTQSKSQDVGGSKRVRIYWSISSNAFAFEIQTKFRWRFSIHKGTAIHTVNRNFEIDRLLLTIALCLPRGSHLLQSIFFRWRSFVSPHLHRWKSGSWSVTWRSDWEVLWNTAQWCEHSFLAVEKVDERRYAKHCFSYFHAWE